MANDCCKCCGMARGRDESRPYFSIYIYPDPCNLTMMLRALAAPTVGWEK